MCMCVVCEKNPLPHFAHSHHPPETRDRIMAIESKAQNSIVSLVNSFMIHFHSHFFFSFFSSLLLQPFFCFLIHSFSISTTFHHTNTTSAHPTPMQQANHNHNHNHPRNTNISLEPPSHHHRSSNNSDLVMLDMIESYPNPDEQFSSLTSFAEEEASSQYQFHGNKICVTSKNTCALGLPVNDDLSSDSSTFSWLNCERPATNSYLYPLLGRVFSFLEWLVFKVVVPCFRHRREPHNPIHL